MKRSPLRSDPDKVREWQNRSRRPIASDPDKTRKWRARCKKLKPRNEARRAASYERNFGSRSDWIRDQPCLIEGIGGHRCQGKIEAAHVMPRKMGGRGSGDRRKLVPLCSAAHREAGEYPQMGRWEGTQRALFEEKYALSLTEKAKEIAELLDRLGYA